MYCTPIETIPLWCLDYLIQAKKIDNHRSVVSGVDSDGLVNVVLKGIWIINHIISDYPIQFKSNWFKSIGVDL